MSDFAHATPRNEIVKVDSLINEADGMIDLIAGSAELRKVLERVDKIAPYATTVLIEGESGTGKELIAKRLHSKGPNPNGPYVIFNCSALVDSLAESQLFGHTRGSFTGARDDTPGFFRAAHNGTLFLDEIGEMPLNLQPKLLRALDAHEVQPVGSVQTVSVNVRVIAATNRNLAEMVKRGQFREDLFYRLGAAGICLPPLRARKEAIPLLIGSFIRKSTLRFSKPVSEITAAALQALCDWDWPGNVRELSHAIEQAVIMSENGRIDMSCLPDLLTQSKNPYAIAASEPAAVAAISAASGAPIGTGGFASVAAPATAPTLVKPPAALEDASPCRNLLDRTVRETVLRTLESTHGCRAETARVLGLSRSTLYRRLARYKIGRNLDGGTGVRQPIAGA